MAVKRLALSDPRIQCLRRVGRRGLSGAILEGVLASSAPFVAVLDGDLQHDERLLPTMLDMLRAEQAELVIGSRYLDGGVAAEGFGRLRGIASRAATRLARVVLRAEVTDPVSGFFMIRRELIDTVAPRLSTSGFKILFDLLATYPRPLRVAELPYRFRSRQEGESKFDARVSLEYLGLLVSKLSRDLISVRALGFGAVGASGLIVHLAVLRTLPGLGFTRAQFIAALVAMTSNYLINNEVTYRDRRRRGVALITGYLRFAMLCSVGFVANVAVASLIHQWAPVWWLAGAGGALFGAVWNYVTTAVAVW
jgi:dolichol-phosphate mannosyltransferase